MFWICSGFDSGFVWKFFAGFVRDLFWICSGFDLGFVRKKLFAGFVRDFFGKVGRSLGLSEWGLGSAMVCSWGCSAARWAFAQWFARVVEDRGGVDAAGDGAAGEDLLGHVVSALDLAELGDGGVRVVVEADALAAHLLEGGAGARDVLGLQSPLPSWVYAPQKPSVDSLEQATCGLLVSYATPVSPSDLIHW